jgi:hypothetical protein
LKEERRFPDTGVSSEENHPPGDKSAAEDIVELCEAGGDSLKFREARVTQGGD